MKIVFMGTPEYAVLPLKQLLVNHEVVAVCTQPDRPAGRGHKMHMSPVKATALSAGVQVLQPEVLKISRIRGQKTSTERGGYEPTKEAFTGHEEVSAEDGKVSAKYDKILTKNTIAKEAREHLASLDADVFVVAAYGLILPKAVLDMPRFGCINIHASLLPKYRGASPINAVIANGETTTGITIMHMDVGIDTGDIILQHGLSIGPDERVQSLHDRMSALGAKCILEALVLMEKGIATRTPQDDAKASYAPMIKKSDGLINWAWPTSRIINLTRAYDPWPGSYTLYKGDAVKIWRVEECETVTLDTSIAGPSEKNTSENKTEALKAALPKTGPPRAAPGTVLAVDLTKGLVVKTSDSAAWITEMQAAGGKRMHAVDYLRGREIKVGEVLGR